MPADEVAIGENFILEPGQQVKVVGEGEALSLKLESVTDSRCPANAMCMWLGNAAVVLKAANTAEKDKLVNMCIGDCRPDPIRSKHIQEIEVGGVKYTITLKEVLPYPGLEQEGEAKQVRLQVQYP